MLCNVGCEARLGSRCEVLTWAGCNIWGFFPQQRQKISILSRPVAMLLCIFESESVVRAESAGENFLFELCG